MNNQKICRKNLNDNNTATFANTAHKKRATKRKRSSCSLLYLISFFICYLEAVLQVVQKQQAKKLKFWTQMLHTKSTPSDFALRGGVAAMVWRWRCCWCSGSFSSMLIAAVSPQMLPFFFADFSFNSKRQQKISKRWSSLWCLMF